MNANANSSADWLGSARSAFLAWWLPHAALLGGLFVSSPARAAIWTAVLIWMGAACILNAQRCGRTHCRYTGPYYLAMIVPVLALGIGILPDGLYAWLILGAIIVLGSKTIWWATERAWGRFS
jgi:hypothetical protein